MFITAVSTILRVFVGLTMDLVYDLGTHVPVAKVTNFVTTYTIGYTWLYIHQ